MKKFIFIVMILTNHFANAQKDISYDDINLGIQNLDGFIEKLTLKGYLVSDKIEDDFLGIKTSDYYFNKSGISQIDKPSIKRDNPVTISYDKVDSTKNTIFLDYRIENKSSYETMINTIKSKCKLISSAYDKYMKCFIYEYKNDKVKFKFYSAVFDEIMKCTIVIKLL